jgi:hypothetical protein
MEGSKNSLGRFLTKAGVDIGVATKVSALSVQLFVNMDAEGISYFAGEEPVDRAILRAAQAALKAELARNALVNSRKRGRGLFHDEEEEGEEEEDRMDILAQMANPPAREAELRKRAQQSRRQPASTATAIYNDPYGVGATTEGKERILTVYGINTSC